MLILVWFERSLHSAQVSRQSCPWLLKLMTSQRVERTRICTGGCRRFRGEWVKRFNWSKTRKNKRNLKTKQWNPLSLHLFSLATTTSWSFQTVWRMCEAWKRETYVWSQSFSSESAVKYLHVGRRKIKISPPPGEQDQSNALPQGQQRQSNPPPALRW